MNGLAPELQCIMHARHLARTDDVLQNTIRLEEDMLAIGYLYLASYDRIDEGQFGKSAVVQFRHRFEDLPEGRFADEHRVEHAVGRVCFGVLADTAARERSVADIHREESVIDRFLAVDGQDHVLRLMLNDSTDESEEVVDVMRADIVLERLGFLAAQRIHSEPDGVDEIAVVLDVITPIGEAADVDRMSFSLKEAAKRFFVILGQVPIPSPIISRAAGHESHLYFRLLFRRKNGSHNAVNGFGERAVSSEDENFVISFFYQFSRQLDCMPRIFGNTVGKRLMPFTQQVPQVDTLCAEVILSRFRIDDDAQHGGQVLVFSV